MQPEELSKFTKEKARELGFQLVGIAPAKAFPESEFYKEWVRQGKAGQLEYMTRDPETRADITRWYPQAQSVVVCGIRYNSQKTAGTSPNGSWGRISRYATSRDYHQWLPKRLGNLLQFLKAAAPDLEGRIFTDTSPLLERMYARYAGIGWIGKNTLLIHPKMGSYFFLGGLALNRQLVPDEPLPDHCGSCTRCLHACPTEAFPRPYQMDASRCIAYFTIELKESIPEEFRSKMQNWVFGCDICQEVCPWNKFSTASQDPALAPRTETEIPLEELAHLTPEEFEKRFEGTPVRRSKWRGFLRNVLIAIGNSKNSGWTRLLQQYLRHPDPVVSEHAAWGLRQLQKNSEPAGGGTAPPAPCGGVPPR